MGIRAADEADTVQALGRATDDGDGGLAGKLGESHGRVRRPRYQRNEALRATGSATPGAVHSIVKVSLVVAAVCQMVDAGS